MSGGGGATARASFDPELEWSTPHPDASAIRGLEELLAFLHGYAGTWQDYRIELEEIRDVGEHRVLVRFWEAGRQGSGVETHARPTGIWTVRTGRAITFSAYADRTEAPQVREAERLGGIVPSHTGESLWRG